MFKLFLAFLAPFLLFSNDDECSIDYSIMYAIQKIERHSKFPIGYPFIISFNSKEDVIFAKKKFDLNWIDNRSINCEELIKCEKILKKLIKIKVDNLDLGSFQINYKYHKMKLRDYFNNKKSYLKACEILQDLIQRYGTSADTIARYHSSTDKYKNIYVDKFFKSFIEEKLIVGADIFYYYFE